MFALFLGAVGDRPSEEDLLLRMLKAGVEASARGWL